MVWYQYVLGAAIILVAIIITIVVLLQEARTTGLSGAISGGSSDTFFGKGKGRTAEKKLVTATKVLGTIFFVLVLGTTVLFMFK